MPEIAKPKGEVCIADVASNLAVCREISTRQALRDRSLNEIDGWITMPLSTLNSVNKYIDDILERLGDSNLKMSPNEIRGIQRDLNLLSEDLQSEKHLL